MTNHLRTLLLNQLPLAVGDATPGEEYVPATFVPVHLPSDVAALRSQLLEPGGDRALLNVRLAQLLACVHATELAAYATDLDPRITYWPPRSSSGRLWRALTFGAAAEQTGGTACPLYFQGLASQFTSSGPLQFGWTVQVLNGTQVAITQTAPQAQSETVGYTVTNGLSSPIPLIGSNLSLVFATPSPPYPSWSVTGLARPQRSLAQILATLPDDPILFRDAEPFATFRSLWEQPAIPAGYRLGAWVLALGYRIQQVYSQGGE